MNTDSETGRPGAGPERSSSPIEEAPLSPEQVVVALLRQQESLLSELSWAYEQLERSQEQELVEIKSRVNQLERQVSKTGGGRFLPATLAGEAPSGLIAVTRRRLEFSIRNPRKALKLAERRLRRQSDAPALEAGRAT
ncbi:hypothetical protein [Nesterenkonia sp. Act20]|uniref:hypothetical protein n=1 Tax=Nesterenkonia sp. Act20 TaxID=1483432 RepID=UPI001C455FC5|nr:hypothetical protein [Nesterenkonia sp. Act20]